MARGRSRLRLAVAIALDMAVTGTAVAGTVQSPSPYRFQETYTSLSSINTTATTIAVHTSDTGTVRLPYARLGVAFDPAGTYGLVATRGGMYAYVFDGQGVVARDHLGPG